MSNEMIITVNGEKKTVQATTIKALLNELAVKMPDMVSVQHNDEMLRQSDFETTVINDGDDIEFLYFMGGG
mgnify:CR=1 FL=1